jgi:hypothetical protein
MNEFELLDLKKEIIQSRAVAAVQLCLQIKAEGGTRHMRTHEIDAVLGTGVDARILKRMLVQTVNPYRRGGACNGYSVNKDELDKLLGVLIRFRDKMDRIKAPLTKTSERIRINSTAPVATATMCNVPSELCASGN